MTPKQLSRLKELTKDVEKLSIELFKFMFNKDFNFDKFIDALSKKTINLSPDDINALGIKFYEKNTEESYTYAIKLYEIAEKGGQSCALFNLGLCHLEGFDTSKSIQKAQFYAEKAIELGDLDGNYLLGSIYKKRKNLTSAKSKFFW